jgi:hypothetical protein
MGELVCYAGGIEAAAWPHKSRHTNTIVIRTIMGTRKSENTMTDAKYMSMLPLSQTSGRSILQCGMDKEEYV